MVAEALLEVDRLSPGQRGNASSGQVVIDAAKGLQTHRLADRRRAASRGFAQRGVVFGQLLPSFPISRMTPLSRLALR
jgi:hypothetical protein